MKITILTPTYNRQDKLKETYHSLVKQSNYNFTWLVIDDGSRDGTSDFIADIIKDCDLFEIKYLKKENGGKHTAINYGLTKTNTDYCLILDSDDILKPNAIDFFLMKWQTLDEHVAAISCLTENKQGSLIGDEFPEDGAELSHIEQTYTMNIQGDKVECYRTSILQLYQFPTFYGEHFLTEGIVWNRIGVKYKKKCFNCSLRVSEYHSDGLSYNLEKNHRSSLLGSFLYHYEVSILNDISKVQKYKHRCVALKFFLILLKRQFFFNLFALPPGLCLMVKSFFK